MSPAGKPHGPLVALSTASVFPDRTPDAFELAARLGYDGIEVMVSADAVSQDVDVIRRLVDYHGIPVLAVHSPCLLVTQRVWGREPWGKLTKSAAVAEKLGARVVVVHPPFRWQRDYARDFTAGLERMRDETDVIFAVENMYPLRAGGAEVAPYSPHWNPVPQDYPAVTLDLSHTSVSGSDAMAMAADLGGRLAHVHLADGTGVTNRDEHLVPGRGTQPCAPLLERLAAEGYRGAVVLEVNTRRAGSREARRADLAEALEFTRRHLAAGEAGQGGPGGGPGRAGTGRSSAARDGVASLTGARHGTGRQSGTRGSGDSGADGSGEAPGARGDDGEPGVRGSGGRSRARERSAGARPRASAEEDGGQARDQDGRRPASGRESGPAAARRVAGRVRSLGWAAISWPAGRGPAALEPVTLGAVALGTADLETADLETADLETADLETADLETAGLGTGAPGTAALEDAALGAAGPEAAGQGGGPLAGARRGVFGRGSAPAGRRWRRLDERARSGASCRS